MYFFSHIPKTAGTSLGFILEYMFNRETFWDYKESYRCDRGLCEGLKSLISSGHISLVGGHITAEQYKPLFLGIDTILMYTARDPYDHFISKLNHDLDTLIGSSGEDLKMISREKAVPSSDGSVLSLPLSEIADYFSLDDIFRDPSMLNYLKVYTEIDGSQPGSRVYPFLTNSLSLSLQYFIWNERQNGVFLRRKDPAMIRQANSHNASSLEWCMPCLNDNKTRPYQAFMSIDEKQLIRSFLKDSIEYYQEIEIRFKREIGDAMALGFNPTHTKNCKFTFAD